VYTVQRTKLQAKNLPRRKNISSRLRKNAKKQNVIACGGAVTANGAAHLFPQGV
jgi:hypothetical protein